VFHADFHEVAVSVIARDATQEVLEAFCTLERIEMVHVEAAKAFTSKENGVCNVSNESSCGVGPNANER
jgi:hypothetical protein